MGFDFGDYAAIKTVPHRHTAWSWNSWWLMSQADTQHKICCAAVGCTRHNWHDCKRDTGTGSGARGYNTHPTLGHITPVTVDTTADT
jgi:hypothetical protein